MENDVTSFNWKSSYSLITKGSYRTRASVPVSNVITDPLQLKISESLYSQGYTTEEIKETLEYISTLQL